MELVCFIVLQEGEASGAAVDLVCFIVLQEGEASGVCAV